LKHKLDSASIGASTKVFQLGGGTGCLRLATLLGSSQ
jgi:hypothetical protein